jgi:molybdopterin-biosynthesis enzyme MoeA-like protein
MAISTQDYVKKPNETIEQYNTRIASLRGDTPAELATMNTLSATSVGSNPTINAGIINAPTPQSVTNSIANILSSAAGTPQYVQGLQQQQADLLKMYQDQSQSILAKMQETTNQPNVSITDELKKLQEQYGIPDYLDKISALAPEITAIQEKINAINQREAQAIENLRGKAISEFTAQGQEAALKRQAAIERSGYAAELGVKQAMVESYKGNITQARSLISDAVQAYTFDIQQKNDDMDRMYKFYGDFIGQLDKNTQNQLSIVRDELATERERQIKDANTIGEMMLKYPNSGIKFSDTVQQAIIKAQPEAASQLLEANGYVGGITPWDDYMQQVINIGGSPQEAIRAAYDQANTMGVSLTQEERNAITKRAQQLKPSTNVSTTTPQATYQPSSKSAYSAGKTTGQFIGSKLKVLGENIGLITKPISSFFGGLFGK